MYRPEIIWNNLTFMSIGINESKERELQNEAEYIAMHV